MLHGVRGALGRWRRPDRQGRAVERDEPSTDIESLRPLVEQLVHEAFQLNEVPLARRIEVLDVAVQQLTAEVRAGLQHNQRHTEAAVEVSERKLTRRIEIARRAAADVAGPAPSVGGGPSAGAAPSSLDADPTGERPVVDAELYVALEDRFRGDPGLIAERQRVYLPYLQELIDAEHPLLDVGCGRGEWLALLREAGIPATGIDTNPVAVAECREAGLEVTQADLVPHLDGLPEGSLGAVTLFQVVEHLPFDVLVHTFRSVARVLRPGGMLIAETPNSLNLRVGATTFWIDPTHQRPLHPEVLVFLAVESGFTSVERLFLHPLGPEPADLPGLPEAAVELLHRLAQDVDGPGDFTLLARTPDALSS